MIPGQEVGTRSDFTGDLATFFLEEVVKDHA
jgi:hypothetical protein